MNFNMSKWSEIYEKQMKRFASIDAFIEHKILYKKRLIDEIIGNAPQQGFIAEIGCGLGILCSFLSKQNFNVVGIDSDREMIRLAKKLNRTIGGNATFVMSEMNNLSQVNLKKIDVIFSNGVMEHYNDKEIVNSLYYQASVAKNVIFSVPSDRYSEKNALFGNERFMGVKKWKALIRESGLMLNKTFGFDEDGRGYEDLNGLDAPQFLGFVVRKKLA